MKSKEGRAEDVREVNSLDLLSDELRFTMQEITKEAFIELLAVLYGQRVQDRFPGHLAEYVNCNVQPEKRWQWACHAHEQ